MTQMRLLLCSASIARVIPMVVPLLGLVCGLGGCISVNTPDKPIVIELNVTIKQEVVYRLAGDAAQTIDKNAGIF